MPRTPIRQLVLPAALALAELGATAGAAQPNSDHGQRPQGTTNYFNITVPAHAFDLILARPEKNSVTLSVLAYQDLEGWIAYGTQPGVYPLRTAMQPFKQGVPCELVMGALQANTCYYYQFRSRPAGGETCTNSPEYTFHTARASGETFTFTLTADAHLDEHTSPEVYCRTLANIRADTPDFHIDLGNLFMTDKHGHREEAAGQYVAQRYYLGQIGCSVPLLLALGTHDGESSRYDNGTADGLAVWSNRIRKQFFPNPVPDDFYTGNTVQKADCGLLQNYYAWEWGDALCVVLDPFGNSVRQRGGGDGWGWSLGQTQYQWLKQTLEQSRARFKFVFIHNLLSGNQAARGGVEVAAFNEWGGQNADGSEGFKEHRPGWDAPIHQLLVRNHVAAVFKAHDNFYARQELDGIVYQMIPQPSFAGNDRIRDLENYGYKRGTFLGNAGHVRVTVAPDQVKVAYIRAYLPSAETEQHKNGETADHYSIPARPPDTQTEGAPSTDGSNRATTAAAAPATSSGWVKSAGNPVMGGKYGTCFDLSVLREGDTYRMWLSWRPKKSVALVESKDGIHWSEPPKIVLGPRTETGWEDEVNRPCVIKRGDTYHMWYTGQAKPGAREGHSWIGYATSQDGVTWKRMSDHPALTCDQPWEKNIAVMNPAVIWDEAAQLFRMWYSGGEQNEPNAIGYATSPDGLTWTKHATNPVFGPDPDNAWERHKVAGVQVAKVGEWYVMFYIGYRDETHAQIGIARSRDGLTNWQRHPGNPIVRPGANAWDHDACYKPFAICDGAQWLLWYNGRHGGLEQIGVARHNGADLGFP